MPREAKDASERQKQRHQPLLRQLQDEGKLKTRTGNATNANGKRSRTNDEGLLDARTSRQILQLAKEQVDEDRTDEEVAEVEEHLEVESDFSSVSEEEMEEEEEEDVDVDDVFNHEPASLQIGETLADKIMRKIEQQSDSLPSTPKIHPKVILVYSKIGELLSRYRSGKLPKAFKIIPTLNNWRQVVELTHPESWSPNACYEATRLFTSNLKPAAAQIFMREILLDRVREDIQKTKKLNVHLYTSLKKALYKPAAFFKGFLFPLCEEDCSLREATIVASVLAKVSLPVLHSSAALLRLAEMDYSGANTIFIRTLIDKKYALPYKVVDALVAYFMRQRTEELPVIWHQTFLCFAQRYKNDISEEQQEALLEAVRSRGHHLVGPEVRRELLERKGGKGEMQMES